MTQCLQGVLKSLTVVVKRAVNELNTNSFSYQLYHFTMESAFKSLTLSLLEMSAFLESQKESGPSVNFGNA